MAKHFDSRVVYSNSPDAVCLVTAGETQKAIPKVVTCPHGQRICTKVSNNYPQKVGLCNNDNCKYHYDNGCWYAHWLHGKWEIPPSKMAAVVVPPEEDFFAPEKVGG